MTAIRLIGAVLVLSGSLAAGDGNRLAYLEENNPWYPHTGFARLTTPQWVGEEGVEAVVILAIDDMRDTAKYEAYLRPILQRLKAIDGRAPVSIMTCNVKPDDPQLQSWLGEGLSIECHTVDHPCPLLQGGDFAKARSTYDRCVDLMFEIPGNTPVAFRTPCCDSLNTVSPRFFAEIFNSRTPGGHHLQIDSSVFCVFTEDDPEIPAELLTDPDGTPKFRKYLPTGLERNGIVHNEFVNWIENYPYPYVINNSCWEFPCMVPSDWEANFYHQPNNPDTVRDMKAALDITVLKQGVFCMVFHPHGWIRAEQMVEFIDHAVETHGAKVKFLTFREALARLNENLLDGDPLRGERGQDNGVRILDVDNDGFMDVVICRSRPAQTRVWQPVEKRWHETVFPIRVGRTRFTVVHEHGRASIVDPGSGSAFREDPREQPFPAWTFSENEWRADGRLAALPEAIAPPREQFVGPIRHRKTQVHTFHDFDHDGVSEAIWQSRKFEFRPAPDELYVSRWDDIESTWKPLVILLDDRSGMRFIDVDGDGIDDIVWSTPTGYGAQLVDWFSPDHEFDGEVSSPTLHARREFGAAGWPAFRRDDGTDNGFFIHSGYLLWQNEDTAHLPDMVEKRSIAELLGAGAADE